MPNKFKLHILNILALLKISIQVINKLVKIYRPFLATLIHLKKKRTMEKRKINQLANKKKSQTANRTNRINPKL